MLTEKEPPHGVGPAMAPPPARTTVHVELVPEVVEKFHVAVGAVVPDGGAEMNTAGGGGVVSYVTALVAGALALPAGSVATTARTYTPSGRPAKSNVNVPLQGVDPITSTPSRVTEQVAVVPAGVVKVQLPLARLLGVAGDEVMVGGLGAVVSSTYSIVVAPLVLPAKSVAVTVNT
jgi:hypothetical protein